MALSVNSNIPSLNAQRNLGNATKLLARTLERLSSGLRINRAGDDAAGLAISETMRAQIRGLNQAVRNANDGISLVGTAEGALNETTAILQRIRELAVQAASETNSGTNRAAIQSEIDQQISELTRIGNTTQFNGAKILDGSFSNKSIHVGANSGESITISIADVRASTLGAVATLEGGAISSTLTSFNISNVAITGYTTDGVSTQESSTSAIAIAAAVNALTGETGVKATVEATAVTGSAAVEAATLATGADFFTINGVEIDVTVQASDTDGALLDAINAVTNQTGVIATLDSSDQIVLTAADGRNVHITGSTGVSSALNLGVLMTNGSAVIHSNIDLISPDNIIVSGDYTSAGFTSNSASVDALTAINSISVATVSGANTAIDRIDYALDQVNSIRAGLGALTNRLESTISNLRVTAENLSASDSRIRDADFAYETANLTKYQILQQAGTAILAQANLTPQAALSLLG